MHGVPRCPGVDCIVYMYPPQPIYIIYKYQINYYWVRIPVRKLYIAISSIYALSSKNPIIGIISGIKSIGENKYKIANTI